MMKSKFWTYIVLPALFLLALSGCASIQYAGNASYSVSPYETKTGEAVCCKVDVHNGKEIANLEAHISKTADGTYTVDLKEQGVAAFEGQRIAAGVTDSAIKAAAAAAAAATLAPVIPLLTPAAAAALSAGTVPAAAVGAAGAVAIEKSTP